MPERSKIVTVVGTRPQFIKAAPVSHALVRAELREIIVHTGQHFDARMSGIFFDELKIAAPTYNLEINRLGHGAMTGRMLEKIEEVLLAEQPSAVLIYGDTNSTVAASLAAAKLHIPLAHVEAGLRSFNRRMPEEINRIVADHLSDLLLCPTGTAVRNLAAEGITNGVHAVGDVMYDATLAAIKHAELHSKILEQLDLKPRTYSVATIHRPDTTENLARFHRVIDWLETAGIERPIIMPVHPRTRDVMNDNSIKPKQIRLIEPLGYWDMARLVQHSSAVFTDSGGLQKEAYFHRVPCVTLRDETEWVETVEAGWNRLWTVPDYRERHDIADYGTGRAAEQIAGLLVPFAR